MDELKDKKWYEDVPYEECKKFISARLRTMTRDFIVVGYYLKYIRDNELYKEDGYTSIWEFAEDNYGIKTSTASRWMAMNDKFSQDGNTPLLDKQYQDFGKSQLQEMLYLTDEQLAQAKPDMPAKEIRAIRKPEKKSYEECAAYKCNGCCDNCHYEDKDDCPYDRTGYKVADWRIEHDRQTQAAYKRAREESGEKVSPLERGCITGWSRYPDFCSCCGYNGAECCNQCDEGCNSRCGWIDEPYVSEPEEKASVEDQPCSKCKLNGNEDAGILECHPEKGEHKCVIEYAEPVAPAQEKSPAEEEKREVLHFTADDRSIDNAYGAMIAGLIHNYLDNGYKSPDKECEAYVFGQTYKVLKRPEVTVFYTEDGQTFFDVENTRLEREYQYWQQNKAIQEQTNDIVNEPEGFDVEEESEECSSAPEVVITPQDVLHEAQKQLNDWVEAFKDDTEPDFIAKLKIIVAALASMVCDLDNAPPEPEPQPELPPLKNNEQRKEWLNNYKSWGLWYSDDHIGARYYRYQFEGGAVLIVEEYTVPATEYFEEHDQRYFHLVGGPEPPKGKHGYGKWQRHECYRRDVSSETELVEFLKEVQKK